MAAAGFLSHYMSGPLPYVRLHITIKKNVLSASLNKTFPSFLPDFYHNKINTYANQYSLKRDVVFFPPCMLDLNDNYFMFDINMLLCYYTNISVFIIVEIGKDCFS